MPSDANRQGLVSHRGFRFAVLPSAITLAMALAGCASVSGPAAGDAAKAGAQAAGGWSNGVETGRGTSAGGSASAHGEGTGGAEGAEGAQGAAKGGASASGKGTAASAAAQDAAAQGASVADAAEGAVPDVGAADGAASGATAGGTAKGAAGADGAASGAAGDAGTAAGSAASGAAAGSADASGATGAAGAAAAGVAGAAGGLLGGATEGGASGMAGKALSQAGVPTSLDDVTGGVKLEHLTTYDPKDPLQAYNRMMFAFNEKADKYALKPVAKAYRAVTPDALEFMVGNFFSNMFDLYTGANNLLQGKPKEALQDVTRFVLNSTLGFFGVADIASELGLPKHNEDLGQTLGKWGVPSGPYFVIPLLGPSTVRDAAARPIDGLYGSVYQWQDGHTALKWQLWTVEKINDRAKLLEAEKMLDDAALDRYTLIRDGWLARRRNAVYDGDPPDDGSDDADDPYADDPYADDPTQDDAAQGDASQDGTPQADDAAAKAAGKAASTAGDGADGKAAARSAGKAAAGTADKAGEAARSAAKDVKEGK